jgi:hypothetical protein
MRTSTEHTVLPEQRDIGSGDHWIRFINMGTHTFIVGRVHDTTLWPSYRDKIMRGILGSLVYSRLNREGVTNEVRRGQVWPISAGLYRALIRAGFDDRNLRAAERIEFEAAFTTYTHRKRELDQTPARRKFSTFVYEVRQLAHAATAANYGQTVLNHHRIGDRRLVLRLSSWPRAEEALRSLERHGFPVAHVGSSALDVSDRSEA